jgi:hypothetical protein
MHLIVMEVFVAMFIIALVAFVECVNDFDELVPY